MNKIEIYTKSSCPYCVWAKELLEQKGLKYTEISVENDETKLAEMLARSEGRRTVPQIFINDKGIGGFDDLKKLELSGELQQLLK